MCTELSSSPLLFLQTTQTLYHFGIYNLTLSVILDLFSGLVSGASELNVNNNNDIKIMIFCI